MPGELKPLNLEFGVDDNGSLKLTKIEGTLAKVGNRLDSVSKKTSAYDGILTRWKQSLRSITSVLFSMQSAIVAVVGALALKKGIQEFASFESGVVSLGRVTDRTFPEIQNDILSLNSALGSSSELVAGYYNAISSGATDTKSALDLVTASAKASTVSGIDQGQTLKGLAQLMTAYNGEIKSATQSADLLFAIEKEGITTFAEIIPHIGSAAAASKLLNISSTELAGAISLITQTAGETSKAFTQYRGVVTGLIKPSESLLKIFEELNVANGEQLISQLGLVGGLKAIISKTDGSTIALGKLFESSEAIRGVVSLMVNDFDKLSTKIKSIEENTKGLDEFWKDFLASLEGKWNTLTNTISKIIIVLVKIGDIQFKNLVDTIQSLADSTLVWLQENEKIIKANLDKTIRFIGDSAKWLYENFNLFTTGVKAFIAYNLPGIIASLPGLFTLATTAAKSLSAILFGLVLRNPFGLLLAGLVIFIDYVRQHEKDFEPLIRFWIEFKSVALQAFETVKLGLKSIYITGKFWFELLFNYISKSIKDASKEVNFLIDNFNIAASLSAGKLKQIPRLELNIGDFPEPNLEKSLTKALNDSNQNLQDIIKNTLAEQDALTDRLLNGTKNNLESVFSDFTIPTNNWDAVLDRFTTMFNEINEKATDTVAKTAQTALTGFTKEEIEKAEMFLNNILVSSQTPMQQFEALQSEIFSAMEKTNVSAKDQAQIMQFLAGEYKKAFREMLESSRDFEAGALRAFLKIKEAATDTAFQIEDAIVGSFNDIRAEFIDLFSEGNFDLKSVISNLYKRQLGVFFDRQIAAPVASLAASNSSLVGGGGGFFNILKSIFPFDTGGIIKKKIQKFDSGGIINNYTTNEIQKFDTGGIIKKKIQKFDSGGFMSTGLSGIIKQPTLISLVDGINSSRGEAVVPLPDGKSIPVKNMDAKTNNQSLQTITNNYFNNRVTVIADDPKTYADITDKQQKNTFRLYQRQLLNA